jgi:four helix bundle protein
MALSFDHERLTVYQLSLEFLDLADIAASNLPPGRAYLADQLHRASTSIVLNTAEGAGEANPKEKARFYRMGQRSATECAALLDAFRVLHLAEDNAATAGRDVLLKIVSMLIALGKRFNPELGGKANQGMGRGRETAK